MGTTSKLSDIKPLLIGSANYQMIALSISIFILLSTFRLIVFLVTGYLVLHLSQSIIFLMALSPAVALLSPKTVTKHWSYLALPLPIIWYLQITISSPLWKTIFYGISTFLLLIVIKQGFQYELEFENKYIITESIFVGILLDLSIRSINDGREPVIYTDIIPKIIFVLVALFFLFILIPSQKTLRDTKPATMEKEFRWNMLWSRNFGVLALFQGILVYTLFFANPGVFTRQFSDKLNLNLIWFTLITFAEVLLLIVFRKEVFRLFKLLLPASLLIFLISILFYPWQSLFLVFWVLGSLSVLIILAGSITQADLLDENHSRSLGLMIFIGLLTDIALLAVIIQFEYAVLNTIITGLFFIYSIISFILYPGGWRL